MRVPSFVNTKMPPLTGLKHPNKPDVPIPAPDPTWIRHENEDYPLLELYHKMTLDEAFPEYIWIHMSYPETKQQDYD